MSRLTNLVQNQENYKNLCDVFEESPWTCVGCSLRDKTYKKICSDLQENGIFYRKELEIVIETLNII